MKDFALAFVFVSSITAVSVCLSPERISVYFPSVMPVVTSFVSKAAFLLFSVFTVMYFLPFFSVIKLSGKDYAPFFDSAVTVIVTVIPARKTAGFFTGLILTA